MDALLGNVQPAPASKLSLAGNLGTGLGGQLTALRNASFGVLAGAPAGVAAARAAALDLVDPLALEIAGVITGLATGTDAELSTAVKVALKYGNAITAGRINEIAGARVAARAAAVASGSNVEVAAAGAAPAVAFDGLIAATVATEAAANRDVTDAAYWSNIKWLAKAIAVNNITTAAIAAQPGAPEISRMNIRVIAHAIAFGNNRGLLENAAINLQNLLNSADGTRAAASILGNPSVTDLHNTILARLKEADVESLTNIFTQPLLAVLRNEFTGKLSVYDPYALPGPEVNDNSLDFDRFLPADVLQAVLENRQKKFFPMARVNISPSYFGLFAPGNQLRFELQRGGASLDPNMPIEMRGRGSLVYGSAIKGGDYNNWQVVGKNAFISDKLDFALQTAIKRLGDRLTETAKVQIQGLITTLKDAERKATEAAENLKTVVKANQTTKLTGDIGSVGDLNKVADEYNNRIGKVAKVEGKLGRVLAALTFTILPRTS